MNVFIASVVCISLCGLAGSVSANGTAPLQLSLSYSVTPAFQTAQPEQSSGHGSDVPVARRLWRMNTADKRIDLALNRWASEAGYAVRWDADRYFLIGADATFSGSFEDAVSAVLATPGIRFSDYPLEACLYQNTPPLIRVTRLGDLQESCQ